jgi:hypothetical protein
MGRILDFTSEGELAEVRRLLADDPIAGGIHIWPNVTKQEA